MLERYVPRRRCATRTPFRRERVAPVLLIVAIVLALCGCGASTGRSASSARTASVPAYVSEPFTHEQKLIEQGAPLIVDDGCSACHLNEASRGSAPNFSSFAGHRVRLADGRSVLVDERFLREGLLDPRAYELRGYDPEPMLTALARLRLASHPAQVAALAAFIEQVGPEPE
jgi:cytochrome c5